MASELIEKIKVFYFLTRGFADYAFANHGSRTRGMLPQAP